MPTMVFISLPITDMERSRAFYEGVGWSINPSFSDDNGMCVVISDTIFVMAMKREFLQTFTDKPIVDPLTTLQTQTALSVDSRDDVDAMLARATAAGGTETGDPQDLGFMYSRDFEDPDGNHFSALWMDPAAAEQGPPDSPAE